MFGIVLAVFIAATGSASGNASDAGDLTLAEVIDWLHVGSLEGLWLTPYGLTVIAKILLFFLLINLGAFNRYVSVPRLQQLGGIDPGKRGIIGRLAVRIMPRQGRGAALRFMQSVRMEAVLVAIVLPRSSRNVGKGSQPQHGE